MVYNKAIKELIKKDLIDSYTTKMFREKGYKRCPECNQIKKLCCVTSEGKKICSKCYEKRKRLRSKTKNIRKKKK